MSDNAPQTPQIETEQSTPISTARVFPVIRHLRKFIWAMQQHIQQRIAHIRAWRFSVFVSQYTASQLCYFAAFACFIYSLFQAEGNYIFLAATIAMVGFVREIINIFHKIWATTLGKSFILISYASTANLALAFAAMKINVITTIEPMPFVFTLGFTTLVLMPIWITLISVVLFLTALIFANFWLLIRLPLLWLGFHLELHWEDKKNAVLTMLIRIIMIPVVIGSLITISLPYFADYLPKSGVIIELSSDDELSVQPALEVQAPTNSDESIDEDEHFLQTMQQRGELVDRLIAHFIWYFEAYPYSACQKLPEQRSVVIDDYNVLLISKTSTAELGYRYDVLPCQIRRSLPLD